MSFIRTFRRLSALLVATTFFLTLGIVAPAAADTIDFSDLGPACTPVIPGTYHGLTWSPNLQPVCNSMYATDYLNSYGAPSGYGATNGSAPGSGISTVSIGSGTFSFSGGLFSSFAVNDAFDYSTPLSALSLQILGYRPTDAIDAPTYIAMIDLDPTEYLASSFSWTGLSGLVFGSGNGPVGDFYTIYGVDGLSWLMTGVQVNIDATPVPDNTSTLSMLGMGLIGIAVLRRRIYS